MQLLALFGRKVYLFFEIILYAPVFLLDAAYGAEEVPFAYGHEGSGGFLCVAGTVDAVEQDGAAVEIVIAQGEVVVDGLFGNVKGCQYQSTGKTYIIFAEFVAENDRIAVFVEKQVEHLAIAGYARVDEGDEEVLQEDVGVAATQGFTAQPVIYVARCDEIDG